MIIILSQQQRQITAAALGEHKTLAQGVAANSKRLHIDDKPALGSIGANDYLAGILANIPSGQSGEVEVDVPLAVIHAWRSMLSLWAKAVNRRSDQLELLTVTANRKMQDTAANALLAQLQDRLDLPQLALEALVTQDNEKANKADVKEAAASDREFAEATDHAPHRGRGAKAGGKTQPVVSRGVSGKDASAGEREDDRDPWDQGAPAVDKAKVKGIAVMK